MAGIAPQLSIMQTNLDIVVRNVIWKASFQNGKVLLKDKDKNVDAMLRIVES